MATNEDDKVEDQTEDLDQEQGDEDDVDTDDASDDGDEKLGEGGKKALDRERERNRELRRRLREAEAKATKKDDAGDDDAAEKIRVEADQKWKPRVVNSAAKAALLQAGATKPERLLRLIEHDDLDVTDSGDVDGLDDEVDRLKEEYPELFGRSKRGKLETGDRGGTGAKKMTATERQVAQLQGRS